MKLSVAFQNYCQTVIIMCRCCCIFSYIMCHNTFVGYSTITLFHRRNGAPTINPVKILRERDQGTHVDLSRETELIPEVVYSIRVFATNTIGESNSSNVEVYTRLQQGQLI